MRNFRLGKSRCQPQLGCKKCGKRWVSVTAFPAIFVGTVSDIVLDEVWNSF